MAFLDHAVKLDAARLTQQAKATIQGNGRLNFTTDAGRLLALDESKSVIIFAVGPKDLGAVVSVKDDPEAFPLKKSGPYYYINFKNYLFEKGIDYKSVRIIYDITRLDEAYNGKPVFKFERRDIAHESEASENLPPEEDDDTNNDSHGERVEHGEGETNEEK